jgi:glycosyltransferase involved in cell wall biosynthesis
MLAPLTTDGRFPGVEIPWGFRLLYPAWDVLRRPPLPRELSAAEVVHATNHAAIPPVRPGQKLVATIHDLTFERFPELFPTTWRWLYRRGMRVAIDEAAALIVPSESVRSELNHAGASPERIHVIPLASSFTPPDDPQAESVRRDIEDWGIAPPYILAAGTIEPRKNLVRLVRAYRRLAADGLPHSLVLLGPDGWGAGELRAELKRGGPGKVIRARFGGHQLAVAFADADVVAYVSLYEGFGLPVLEAMSVGTPVVTSNASSLPEVAGDAALLVDPTDEEAIADALRRILTDPALREDLRRRGLQRAGRYSWDATARATLDVYREVAG